MVKRRRKKAAHKLARWRENFAPQTMRIGGNVYRLSSVDMRKARRSLENPELIAIIEYIKTLPGVIHSVQVSGSVMW